jgi:hypothetical protein
MNKTISTFIALPIVWMTWSCGPSLKVSSDYDRNADFSGYKTFALYSQPDSAVSVSQLNHQRIINAVTAEMTGKGFREADGEPDLLVNPVAIVRNKVSVSSNTNYYGYGGYYRPYAWGGGYGAASSTTYNVDQYKEGSLIIDVVDARTKKLLWQGIGNSKIDTDVRDPDQRIREAINKIMANFPPGATSKS